MTNPHLLRAVATTLRKRPASYNQGSLEGNATSPQDTNDACDIIGHILMHVGCHRKYGATGYDRPIWCHATNRRVDDPVKHALSSVEFLGDEETRDWYRSDWTPPGRYGEGAEGVANYFEALAVHAEFLLILEGGDDATTN